MYIISLLWQAIWAFVFSIKTEKLFIMLLAEDSACYGSTITHWQPGRRSACIDQRLNWHNTHKTSNLSNGRDLGCFTVCCASNVWRQPIYCCLLKLNTTYCTWWTDESVSCLVVVIFCFNADTHTKWIKKLLDENSLQAAEASQATYCEHDRVSGFRKHPRFIRELCYSLLSLL
jgi:hypothetical protein